MSPPETPTPDVFDPSRHPHRRFDPLSGSWVVVSPQRTKRPWQGATGAGSAPGTPSYDPGCYLCPGNERAGGVRNPAYESTFVFDNDFAALLPEVAAPGGVDDPLFRTESADGECRVICFSPRHDRTLGAMEIAEIEIVVDLWRSQYAELIERYEWVQIFETRGAISGASNPHPHGQIWSSSFVPDVAAREIETQRAFLGRHGTSMLVEYARRESIDGERTVVENEHWIVVVPYWAYWPYESLVLPKREVASLTELTPGECRTLAEVLSTMLRGFDRLFDTPFPYCSGWHGAPASGAPGFQLHAHYLPPLLRSADVAKIAASYEQLGNLQRDLTPEFAADHLRRTLR